MEEDRRLNDATQEQAIALRALHAAVIPTTVMETGSDTGTISPWPGVVDLEAPGVPSVVAVLGAPITATSWPSAPGQQVGVSLAALTLLDVDAESRRVGRETVAAIHEREPDVTIERCSLRPEELVREKREMKAN